MPVKLPRASRNHAGQQGLPFPDADDAGRTVGRTVRFLVGHPLYGGFPALFLLRLFLALNIGRGRVFQAQSAVEPDGNLKPELLPNQPLQQAADAAGTQQLAAAVPERDDERTALKARPGVFERAVDTAFAAFQLQGKAGEIFGRKTFFRELGPDFGA